MRAFIIFLLALRSAGYAGLLEYHHDWVRNSSVAEKSAVCREHKLLLEILRMLTEHDQVDPSGLAGTELLVRRLYLPEVAAGRHCQQPVSNGLDALADTSPKASGSVDVPGMARWFSEHQKSEAFVINQMRLWSDERKVQSKEW